jgi:predicted YcjX-like family ATPase
MLLKLIQQTLSKFQYPANRDYFSCPDNDRIFEYTEIIQQPLKMVALSCENRRYVMMVCYIRYEHLCNEPVLDKNLLDYSDWSDEIEKGTIEQITHQFHTKQLSDGWIYALNSLVDVQKESFQKLTHKVAEEWSNYLEKIPI